MLPFVTEIAKMKEQQALLEQQIKEKEREDLERRLRWCFTQLGTDFSLPVSIIVKQLLGRNRGFPFPFKEFTERLEALVKGAIANQANSGDGLN